MPVAAFTLLLTLSLQTKYSVPLQVSVHSDTPMIPLLNQGKAYLCYELEIVNYELKAAILTKLSVTNGSGQSIATFSGEKLKEILVPQSAPENSDPAKLEPGKLVVAYMWLSFPQSAIPKKIGHVLTFQRTDGGPPTSASPLLSISPKRGRIVQPPLRGSNWIACTAPSNTSAHRRARMVLDGHASIAQRFAIDWLRVDGSGHTFKGAEDKNESYFAYGQSVLVCADARVVEVVDGIPQNVPHSDKIATVITARTMPGNHVVLDLGHGVYAAYAHLIPGSIRVREGQRVKVGQVVGKVGNSGQSAEPHLHFQLMNGPNFIASDGLPFGLPLLTIQQTEISATGQDLLFKLIGKRVRMRDQEPLENDWVAFPK